jgi:hypothetical protein
MPRMTAATPVAEASSRATLFDLLKQGASARDIASHLDALAVRERLEQVLAITAGNVGKLYDAVEGAPTITLEEWVPKSEKGTAIREGRNSLPGPVSRFQKRFQWVGDQLIGYNHQWVAPITGPGYFETKAAPGTGNHPTEMYFDYRFTPPSEPAGWPPFKPNDKGLSKLVYGGMVDTCRRVATGVLVGKAYQNGKAQGAYFTLTAAS